MEMDKFHQLLKQIEKEYDLICAENAALKEIIVSSHSKDDRSGPSHSVGESPNIPIGANKLSPQLKIQGQQLSKRDSMANASHLLTHKLKSKYRIKSASTRIFGGSSAQTPNSSNKLIRQFEWHKDGVWYVTADTVRNNRVLIGSASADGTACVADATRFLTEYAINNKASASMVNPSSNVSNVSGNVTTSPGPASTGSISGSNITGANMMNQSSSSTSGVGGGAGQQGTSSPTASYWSGQLPHILYAGHAGSVNCIRFHTSHDLVLTASGDGTAHIWRCPPTSMMESINSRSGGSQDDDNVDGSQAVSSSQLSQPITSQGGSSAGGVGTNDDVVNSSGGPQGGAIGQHQHVIRQPLKELTGHSSTVVSCDWLAGVDQCVTASWDRTAIIYDYKTGELVNQLAGHDQELTHVCAHTSAPLIVTASEDTTFRLWDFREAIHSVCVFQGHSESVTSATFFGNDKVISASDDRTCKIWDLRNMRAPLTTIYVEAPINKIAVSQSHNLIAIPLDNRNVRFYDINGQRLNRLPRTHHQRMATCTAFIPQPQSATSLNSSSGSPTASGSHCNPSSASNLFLLTCGFDRRVAMWNVPAPCF